MSDPSPPSWQTLPNAPPLGTPLGHRDDIADGSARLLELAGAGGTFGVVLLRSGEQVFAYANRCAHFGVPLARQVEHLHLKPHESLACSVHYARYRWQDGKCTAGDCVGEFLIALPVAQSADGQLRIGGSPAEADGHANG